jgi:hypothetical protein
MMKKRTGNGKSKYNGKNNTVILHCVQDDDFVGDSDFNREDFSRLKTRWGVC